MSAADEQDPKEITDAEPAPAKAAAKKPVAKAAKAKEAGAAKPAAKAKESAAEKPAKAAAKKPAAKKPAAKAGKESAAASEKPPATESKSTAAGARATLRRPTVRAHARYVRTSARKARMVCGHLRGKSVQEARAILAFTPRDVARDWSKLLESAVANAENNHELLEDDLVVREAYADEGPTIKRFRPRAMGRATPIRKRTSHLTITLSPRP
jgi:ribosomal protein L22